VPIDALATTQHEPAQGVTPSASGSARVSQPRAAPTRIANRYAVTSSLGSGGMGEVFAALDEQSGERVAVKVLHRRDASARGVERLLREASAAGRVQHPAVVRVFEAGVDEANDLAYIAQELLVGETLRALLARRGPLDSAEAVALLSPVVEALAAAHDAGVVHRDLKPENIFVEGEGEALRPRVIDFGIARLMARDEDHVTQLTTTGAVLGTPTYMSPEQARGADDVDEQTDVWAVGVVLYELLTGATPFARATPHATLAAILLDPVVSPREAAPAVPEVLATVVLRALARNRVERFGSMHELAEALRGAAVAPSVATRPPPAALAPPPPRRRAPVIAASAAAFALAVAFGLSQRAPSPRPVAPAPRALSLRNPAAPAAPITLPVPSAPAAIAVAPPPRAPALQPSNVGAPRAPVRPARRVASPLAPTAPTELPTRRVNGAPIVGL
jgi:serine/threonine-protein kinase